MVLGLIWIGLVVGLSLLGLVVGLSLIVWWVRFGLRDGGFKLIG